MWDLARMTNYIITLVGFQHLLFMFSPKCSVFHIFKEQFEINSRQIERMRSVNVSGLFAITYKYNSGVYLFLFAIP